MSSSRAIRPKQSHGHAQDNKQKAYNLLNDIRESLWIWGEENAKHFKHYQTEIGQCAIKGCEEGISLYTANFGFYWVDVLKKPEGLGLYVCPAHQDGTSKDPSKVYDSEMAAARTFLKFKPKPGVSKTKDEHPAVVCNWEFVRQTCNFECTETSSRETYCNKIYKGDHDVWDQTFGAKQPYEGKVPEMKWVCYKPGCLQSAKNWAISQSS